MKQKPQYAELPMGYEVYVFDLYGTLVDIETDEDDEELWQKLALFYGYYNAIYEPKELKEKYLNLVSNREAELKSALEEDAKYSHEANPEINLLEVFCQLFEEKGITPTDELALHVGQAFRIYSTKHLCLYPGAKEMLLKLGQEGKNVYLLSNAQRIFTAYEMKALDIEKYFDGILISSDYKTKKPDKRFFDRLIEKYQIDANKTLFVGNDSKTDIAGAKQVGFDTFYVKSNISPEGDFAKDATYSVDNFVGYR